MKRTLSNPPERAEPPQDYRSVSPRDLKRKSGKSMAIKPDGYRQRRNSRPNVAKEGTGGGSRT